MIIIIGTGLAGYQVARELRKLNAEIPITLITENKGDFYPKPQLSVALTGKKNAEKLVSATADAMAKQLNVTIHTQTKVLAINPDENTITMENGQLSYDQLVLACGADVIKAPIQGNAVSEILSINHLYHYMEFEKLIKNKKHITILGAGLIGCEFANDLSNVGYEVHVVAPDKTPLERFLPKQIGTILQDALTKNNVHFHLATIAEHIEKIPQGYRLQLANGEILNTEFVLSAIGLRPHVALAKTGDLKINRGIMVNKYLTTNVPNIFALGDCAEVAGHVLPFITPILQCARALAKTLNGEKTAVEYPPMPVTVKTPSHPIVVCPPPSHIEGNWEVDATNTQVRAFFYDVHHQLYGFVLTNDAIKERAEWMKKIPDMF